MNFPTENFSNNDLLYITITIPCLTVLSYVISGVHKVLLVKLMGKYDNSNPRLLNGRVKKMALNGNKLARMVTRTKACQRNNWENLIIWTATVLIILYFGSKRTYALTLVTIHLVARILYTFAYIFIDKNSFSIIRTILFYTGLIAALLIQFESIISFFNSRN